MKKSLFIALSSLLMLLASASSVFACAFWGYQPEVPKSLRK
ncbi:MAG: cyclic lactone autoinducer peptide [Dehalobacterium sp.]|jgi:AgrD protein